MDYFTMQVQRFPGGLLKSTLIMPAISHLRGVIQVVWYAPLYLRIKLRHYSTQRPHLDLKAAAPDRYSPPPTSFFPRVLGWGVSTQSNVIRQG